MAKNGRSEKKKDWLGREYIQHYNSKGEKSGRSEQKRDWLGNKYTEHRNARGDKTGHSERKKDWLGNSYTQKFDSCGEKSGRSERKKDWLGSDYTQHYDKRGRDSGTTERKKDWLGNEYRERRSGGTSTRTPGQSTHAPSSAPTSTGVATTLGGGARVVSRGPYRPYLVVVIACTLLAVLWFSFTDRNTPLEANKSEEVPASLHVVQEITSAEIPPIRSATFETFRYDLLACRSVRQHVVCHFRITNLDQEARLGISPVRSRLFDPEGYEYTGFAAGIDGVEFFNYYQFTVGAGASVTGYHWFDPDARGWRAIKSPVPNGPNTSLIRFSLQVQGLDVDVEFRNTAVEGWLQGSSDVRRPLAISDVDGMRFEILECWPAGTRMGCEYRVTSEGDRNYRPSGSRSLLHDEAGHQFSGDTYTQTNANSNGRNGAPLIAGVQTRGTVHFDGAGHANHITRLALSSGGYGSRETAVFRNLPVRGRSAPPSARAQTGRMGVTLQLPGSVQGVLSSCRRVGSNLGCDIWLEAMEKDVETELHSGMWGANGSFIRANNVQQHDPYQVELANSRGDAPRILLVRGVPIAGRLLFRNVDPSVQHVEIFIAATVDGSYRQLHLQNVQVE